MRILYLHQYFNTPQTSGGTRSYEMARRLVASGHQVTMITSSAELGDDFAPTFGWHSHQIEGIDVEVLRVSYNNSMSFSQRIGAFFHFALGAAWHARKFPADVIFATSTPLTIAIPGLFAKIWHQAPMVFEVRDLWPELPIAVGALRNPLARGGARWLEWIAYHASAHVVALSPGMADGVRRRGIPASRITIIPNSCDVDLFEISTEQGAWVRSRLGMTQEQPLIVYTGTFGLINGVGYLVNVAAAMRTISPDVRFLLIGRGAEFDQVSAQAAELEVLNQNLWIWPSLPKAKMPQVLAAATLATSLFIDLEPMWHNSANKFFDALASGTPIAINHEGWQADLLREKGAGLVMPARDPAAAQLLAAAVQDKSWLNQARVAATALAHGPFNRDRLAMELERVLCQAVDGLSRS